jgi:hypothetical protein
MTKAAPATLKIRMPAHLREMIEESAREHGISLNSEIVGRLEHSFRADQALVNIMTAAERADAKLTRLQTLISETLELARKLQEDELKNSAIKIAQDLVPVQEALFSAVTAALGKEPSK